MRLEGLSDWLRHLPRFPLFPSLLGTIDKYLHNANHIQPAEDGPCNQLSVEREDDASQKRNAANKKSMCKSQFCIDDIGRDHPRLQIAAVRGLFLGHHQDTLGSTGNNPTVLG